MASSVIDCLTSSLAFLNLRRPCDHALMNGTPDALRFPHSRWNEVREDELTAAGYSS